MGFVKKAPPNTTKPPGSFSVKRTPMAGSTTQTSSGSMLGEAARRNTPSLY